MSYINLVFLFLQISSASGIAELRAGGGVSETGRTALDNKTSLLNTMPPHSSPRSRDYNPYNYSDSSFNKSALKEAMFDDDAEQFPDGKLQYAFCSRREIVTFFTFYFSF